MPLLNVWIAKRLYAIVVPHNIKSQYVIAAIENERLPDVLVI